MTDFDLIVLGAGPGGYTAALAAAALGKAVMLCESSLLGGTCLNRGCIPTKALLRAAGEYNMLQNAKSIGVSADNISFNFDEMFAFASDTVQTLRGGIEMLLKKAKISVVNGKAIVTEKGVVEVNGTKYTADNIIIATGSVPSMPPIEGAELTGVITSDDMLTNGGIPCKSLVIIGGGVVGAEFAQIYNSLGAKVTIIEAMPKILPLLDRELSQNLSMIFKKRGIDVHTNASVNCIEKTANGLKCRYTEKDIVCEAESEYVLVCTGRMANTKAVLADSLGITTPRGYIKTDATGKTAIDGIYAIGDVVDGGIQLAHAAEAMGTNAVNAMFGVKVAKEMLVPSCVFTQPEIACVGITQDEAREKGIAVETSKGLTSANGKATIEAAERGFIKLVYRAEDKKLIGAQLMCPHASEMIGGITAAINAGITRETMESTVFPHPTISETILG
ncbi:MAG: dihydrolipoyl dehydrogenase [Oscillospiraceae bacterium]